MLLLEENRQAKANKISSNSTSTAYFTPSNYHTSNSYSQRGHAIVVALIVVVTTVIDKVIRELGMVTG